MSLDFSPTHLQQIHEPFFDDHQVKVFVKRFDLLHTFIAGNKLFKMKYNLEEADRAARALNGVCAAFHFATPATIANFFFRELQVSNRIRFAGHAGVPKELFGLLFIQLQVASFPVADNGDSVKHWWPPSSANPENVGAQIRASRSRAS